MLAAGRRLVRHGRLGSGRGLAELTASAVDFVWIDLEHGALSGRDVQPLAIAARSAGAASLVRVRGRGRRRARRPLDAGVDGVVVPRVERAADAERVAGRLRHPPRGSRGLAARRASAYGRAPRNGRPVLIAQIESAGAARRAPARSRPSTAWTRSSSGAPTSRSTLGEPAELGSRRSATPIVHVSGRPRRGHRLRGGRPGDPGALAELAGERSTVLVLGADVRIYAGALSDLLGRLRDGAREAPEPEESHVGT